MAPIMEGSHTVLHLYQHIQERSHTSLYVPKRRAPGFTYGSHAPGWAGPSNDQADDHPPADKQRGQSSIPAGELLNSSQATKEAVSELFCLAAEHRRLLTQLLSLCGDCANKVRMGNQEGKLQGHGASEGREGFPGQAARSSSPQHTLPTSPEQKKASSRGRKLKRLGGKKLNPAEELPHSKGKKKSGSESCSVQALVQTSASIPAASVVAERRVPGTPASVRAPDTPASGSYVSVASNLPLEASNSILPLEEHFHIARDAWSFMEDSGDLDFCNDLSEYDSELFLGYEASSCSLMDSLHDLTQQEPALSGNLRPLKRLTSPDHVFPAMVSEDKTALQLYEEIHRRESGVRVVAKVQETEGRVQRVSHMSPDKSDLHPGSGSSMPQPGTSGLQQGCGEWRGPCRSSTLEERRENTGSKLPEGLWLPLSKPAETFHSKSPSSPSLSGVFNTSYPPNNTLQSMSPVLSPLSPRLHSPQFNHRILLLADEDVTPGGEAEGGGDQELRVTTEVVDRNGNKRTITRLDLNLSRQPGSSKWNSCSLPLETEDALLRQDHDIWMLDGEDSISHEALSRASRPDHLDFLRITPP
ncbi:formin-1-like [Osmerus mordax]|uniref:formin-1-like n=1 Tax=Osmerus mordax TaxID=8014 RepID=UPI0035106C02